VRPPNICLLFATHQPGRVPSYQVETSHSYRVLLLLLLLLLLLYSIVVFGRHGKKRGVLNSTHIQLEPLIREFCIMYAQRVPSARSMFGVASQAIKMRGSAHNSLRVNAVTIQNPTGTSASSRPPEKNGGYDGKGTRFAWLHIQQTHASVIISTLLMSCGSPPQSLRVSARFDCIGLHVCEGKARREAEKG
jgi:hypothetical protein